METGEKRLCGQQAVWEYEEDKGRLIIQGVGTMEDYTEPEQVPWNALIQEIKTVVIRNGITTVGDYAFAGCSSLQEVTLPQWRSWVYSALRAVQD